MKYFEIRNSLNVKEIGKYPQVETAKNNCHIWDDPKFIERFEFDRIDSEVITSNAILHKRAKITDLVSAYIIGFSLKLLMSSKLKNILEQHSNSKFQFFRAPIIYKNEYYENYWIMHSHTFSFNYIDFEKSNFVLRKRKLGGGTFLENIEIRTIDEFKKVLNCDLKSKRIKFFCNNVILKSTIGEDFFSLRHVSGGFKHFVSEKLKVEIDKQNCTGIEFIPQPIN
ncbi:hypothetical protein [uncultured Christiangramia sp.]|uniref:hypothetical protein n=1 Tax=Christiangramia sp. 3-2217-3z TaxID=3417564 RepID=UPI0026247CBC|nr:hypothetical protein [uncultured Christiangramia sp.]